MKNYTSRLTMLVFCLISCSNISHCASELSEYEKFPNSEELPEAARKNDIKKVKELLKAGYNINSVWKPYKWSSLIEAAGFGCKNILDFLIQNPYQRVEIDQQNFLGHTALIDTVLTDGKRGEKTKDLAYPLLRVGADHTIQSKNHLCFVNLIKKLDISDQEKKTMKKKSKKIVQNRWNVICSGCDDNGLSKDLILLFFSFLYDENNDKLGINKEAYFERVGGKRKYSDNQANSRKRKKACRNGSKNPAEKEREKANCLFFLITE